MVLTFQSHVSVKRLCQPDRTRRRGAPSLGYPEVMAAHADSEGSAAKSESPNLSELMTPRELAARRNLQAQHATNRTPLVSPRSGRTSDMLLDRMTRFNSASVRLPSPRQTWSEDELLSASKLSPREAVPNHKREHAIRSNGTAKAGPESSGAPAIVHSANQTSSVSICARSLGTVINGLQAEGRKTSFSSELQQTGQGVEVEHRQEQRAVTDPQARTQPSARNVVHAHDHPSIPSKPAHHAASEDEGVTTFTLSRSTPPQGREGDSFVIRAGELETRRGIACMGAWVSRFFVLAPGSVKVYASECERAHDPKPAVEFGAPPSTSCASAEGFQGSKCCTARVLRRGEGVAIREAAARQGAGGAALHAAAAGRALDAAGAGRGRPRGVDRRVPGDGCGRRGGRGRRRGACAGRRDGHDRVRSLHAHDARAPTQACLDSRDRGAPPSRGALAR